MWKEAIYKKIFGFSSNYDRIPLSYCGTLCMAIGQEKERKVLDVISSEYIYICNKAAAAAAAVKRRKKRRRAARRGAGGRMGRGWRG